MAGSRLFLDSGTGQEQPRRHERFSLIDYAGSQKNASPTRNTETEEGCPNPRLSSRQAVVRLGVRTGEACLFHVVDPYAGQNNVKMAGMSANDEWESEPGNSIFHSLLSSATGRCAFSLRLSFGGIARFLHEGCRGGVTPLSGDATSAVIKRNGRRAELVQRKQSYSLQTRSLPYGH